MEAMMFVSVSVGSLYWPRVGGYDSDPSNQAELSVNEKIVMKR